MSAGIDFGSALDVVIGLSFLFFLSATLCSAINEAIASVFRWRTKDLRRGISNLIGSDLAAGVFKDPRVLSLGQEKSLWLKKKKRKLPIRPLAAGSSPSDKVGKYIRDPSYIPARTFAAVTLDLLSGLDDEDLRRAGLNEDEKKLIESLRSGGVTQTKDVPLSLLSGAFREVRGAASDDLTRLHKALEIRFEDTMDRASGWYKRRALIWIVAIAALMSTALNLDSFQVTKTLASDQELTRSIADQAETESNTLTEKAEACAREGGLDATECQGKVAEEARQSILDSGFPIGWTTEKWHALDSAGEWIAKVLGLLVTIIAIAVGAPFWYGALGRLVPLRAAGSKPADPDPQVKAGPS